MYCKMCTQIRPNTEILPRRIAARNQQFRNQLTSQCRIKFFANLFFVRDGEICLIISLIEELNYY
jgi:hypothetical protein